VSRLVSGLIRYLGPSWSDGSESSLKGQAMGLLE
jgi:hypothetical protein